MHTLVSKSESGPWLAAAGAGNAAFSGGVHPGECELGSCVSDIAVVLRARPNRVPTVTHNRGDVAAVLLFEPIKERFVFLIHPDSD